MPWACCQGQRMHASKAKARRHVDIAKAKACMQPRPRQPHRHAAKAKSCTLPRPWQPQGHAANANTKACSQCQASPHGYTAKAKAGPMGTQPRPRHAAFLVKARRHGHAAKAKACILPRLGQPHGNTTKAKVCSPQGQGTSPWARCQGQSSPMSTLSRPRQACC